MKVKIALETKSLTLVLIPETKEEKVLLDLAPGKTFFCKTDDSDLGSIELETTSL